MYNTIFFFVFFQCTQNDEQSALSMKTLRVVDQVSNEPRSKMSAGIMYVDRAHLLEGVTIQNRIN
jgi:hypothetical protein